MTPANLLTDWSDLVVDSLVAAGVRDLVISPGSRSTALVLAAARHPSLRCHDCVDERAAAFFALGQVRATGRPSALLCTSGTAAAQYYPAIVEASVNHLPLVVLTADRPLELVDCAAPQTIDQVKMYGDFVRRFVDLGVPDPTRRALLGARRAVVQAVFASTWPTPGPVHLNARARKPFEPAAPVTQAERDLREDIARMRASVPVPVAPRSVPDPAALDRLADRCRSSARGVIVCGPAPLGHVALREAVHALAARVGWPLLVEGASQLRFAPAPADVAVCDAFDLTVRGPLRDAAPELVLQIGAPPVSAAWADWLDRHEPDRVVLAAHGWNDWQATADTLLFGDLGEAVRGLVDRLDPLDAPDRAAWRDRFVTANRAAWEAVDRALEGSELSEGAVVREVVESMPAGELLMVGNSLAIRLLDTYARADRADVGVLSQRGANGIDGLIASTAGTASVVDRPVTLILGDVSALHDIGALALTRAAPVPVTIVVLQNGGGRIFDMLPVARAGLDEAALAHVTTPHDLDFAHAAAQFGHGYARVTDLDQLRDALDAARRGPGATLIEAVVPPHGAAALLDRVRAELVARSGGAA